MNDRIALADDFCPACMTTGSHHPECHKAPMPTFGNAAAVWIDGRAAMVIARDEINRTVLVEYATPAEASSSFRRTWVPAERIAATHPAHCQCGACPIS